MRAPRSAREILPVNGRFCLARSLLTASGMKAWAIGLALAGVAASSACGGSSRRTDAEAVAGAASVGGAGTGAVASAGSTSAGGSGAAGSSGAGGGASPGGTGGSSMGGAPVRFPLIVGDDACPPASPTSSVCTVPGASCVYRGLEAGLSVSDEPFHCVCDGGQWTCAQSDENGELTCPSIESGPGPSDPCPASGNACSYLLWSGPALVVCYCTERGGAGGAEAAPSSSWFCGV
jgi:hypothetical protein